MDDPCVFTDVSTSSHKKNTKPNMTKPFKNGDFLQFFYHNSSLGLHRDLGFSRGWPLWLPWYSYIISQKNYQTKYHATSQKWCFLHFFGHNSSLGLDKRPVIFMWITLVTSLMFLYHVTKKYQTKHHATSQKLWFFSFLAITQVWGWIETWGFCLDGLCHFSDIPI